MQARLRIRSGEPLMPTLRIDDSLEMFYQVDDFTEPWTKPQSILLMHGNAESGDSWFRWVPLLARWFRVIRADMRGFGRSTPMPRDLKWSFDMLANDYSKLLDHLGVDSCHVVGAKLGGTVARTFAARKPQRVRTLTVVSSPGPTRSEYDDSKIAERLARVEKDGMEAWAGEAMAQRLGGFMPPEGVAWWTKFMGRSPVSTQFGFVPLTSGSDITDDIRRIQCPTLIITTDGSALISVEDTRAWAKMIPDSEMMVLKADAYHPAVTHAEECARATLKFIEAHGGPKIPAQ